MFLLQVNDYAENTYFSNFISHLEDVKYPGKEGRRMSVSVMWGQKVQARVALVGRVAGKPVRGAHPSVRGVLSQRLLLLAQASNTSEKPDHKRYLLIATIGTSGWSESH